jgi:hypothetical protein
MKLFKRKSKLLSPIEEALPEQQSPFQPDWDAVTNGSSRIVLDLTGFLDVVKCMTAKYPCIQAEKDMTFAALWSLGFLYLTVDDGKVVSRADERIIRDRKSRCDLSKTILHESEYYRYRTNLALAEKLLAYARQQCPEFTQDYIEILRLADDHESLESDIRCWDDEIHSLREQMLHAIEKKIAAQQELAEFGKKTSKLGLTPEAVAELPIMPVKFHSWSLDVLATSNLEALVLE